MINMIKIDEKERRFYLHTRNTSYVMGVGKYDFLQHLYWGKRLKNELTDYETEEVSQDHWNETALPLEFSTFGAPDMRFPTMDASYANGSLTSRFTYAGYEVIKGKPKLQGLPATYCEAGDLVETLIVHLTDPVQKVDVYLNYTVFEEFDVLTRSIRIVNHGERMELRTALSCSVDLYGLGDADVVTLNGSWGRERAVSRNNIAIGNQSFDSRHGASSHMQNPFMAICEKNADEHHGNVYAMSLVYSGSFTAGVERDNYGTSRAYIGIQPMHFNYVLETEEMFETPEAVLVFSSNGLGEMSRIYHRIFRKRLCRGKYRDRERFVLANNWEATHFDFDEEKILSIAKKASEIGIDTFVLDDGWFAERNDTFHSLGDWYVNKTKLPHGLDGLADRINAMGMRFGLWFEPEMISPKSKLYEEHPEWILQVEGRPSTLRRNQLTLDLSQKDICDYLIESVSNILGSAHIEYVKWDMNRFMTEPESLRLPSDRQGEVMHRYILGLYYILETLTERFPEILFESCASGGGRFDPGMLYYMPQVWTSDDTDAVERLHIQYGTSMVYPYSSMGAHVTKTPNMQVGRTTPFQMRCNVAMPGQFGFELDLNNLTEEEVAEAKEAITEHRRIREIFHNGDLYRLRSPYESPLSALEFISEDQENVIVCIDSIKATPNSVYEFIRLRGLDENACYKCKNNGEIFGGDYLMNRGMKFVNDSEYQSVRYLFEKE